MRKIERVLIANRGEIAIRISETARKMGIRSFMIRTSKEPSAVYLKYADEIIDFSDNPDDLPEFLDIDRILNAAKDYKIDAVHPGYGFLAENPYFAQRCEDEGIIFVGPSPDSIYKMGNKTIAKQLARKARIPLLEGSHGNVASVQEALGYASKIGYPVILKAAAGGGGRGMRIVNSDREMERNFHNAIAEAEKAFNDPSVFIEKYVKNPRHIEFQVLGDKHGNLIHLGERECSIQRKHQKLIEEAPSWALDADLREKMASEALKIAGSVQYHSTGTVEFLLDDEKNFYFMEMNTRIQVEHPVTELVTGIDLVEWQLRIAAGEKLTIKQEDVRLSGWAIECRINAEDPQAHFSPALGTIRKIAFPKGKNIRVDSGVEDGSVITPFYDSMLAKLITTGETREKAISAMIQALNKTKIMGVKTIIPFHKAVMHHRKFRKGHFNTSFILNEMETLWHQEPSEKLFAAFLATIDYQQEVMSDQMMVVDYNKGRQLSPWIINKRMK
ncbi:MAG: acetyl-CoA carboxylase biotin carboxylase subunit [Bacteroidales bacterium]